MALLAKVVLTQRAHARRQVGLDGTLRIEGKPHDIVIKDLSVSGCCATTSVDLRPGDCVMISSPANLFRKAKVIWARNGDVGFMFTRPLTAAEVAIAKPADTVIQFPATDFCDPPQWRVDRSDLTPEKWPIGLRVATILGLSFALWFVIIVLVSRL
jgi:hypothetical protein